MLDAPLTSTTSSVLIPIDREVLCIFSLRDLVISKVDLWLLEHDGKWPTFVCKRHCNISSDVIRQQWKSNYLVSGANDFVGKSMKKGHRLEQNSSCIRRLTGSERKNANHSLLEGQYSIAPL